MIIDVTMILKLAMPKGAFEQPGDLIGCAVFYGLYVAMMALATWPGTRCRPRPADGSPRQTISAEKYLDEDGGDVASAAPSIRPPQIGSCEPQEPHQPLSLACD